MARNAPVIIIPARLGSKRLPSKPLLKINGEPLILHVWRQAKEADIAPVFVATDSESVAKIILDAGGMALITRVDHASGSDRIFEALTRLDPEEQFGKIINLQGDQFGLTRHALSQAVGLLDQPGVDIGTLATRFTPTQVNDPNIVKVIAAVESSNRARALYFTRAPAPWGEGPMLQHIGVYAFKREILSRFSKLAPSPLELRERLEQLRALEAGMRIDLALVDHSGLSVDTSKDIDILTFGLAD
ncbi:MAG: 3-deoxy-manno-octulosonate cytidylyltransferase [Methylocystaceae bacterium]|nr:3-deoxy-manno-octulosonate cytidylyltransferase [Methylocystaceae bacterium]